jgi:hypothetical protein
MEKSQYGICKVGKRWKWNTETVNFMASEFGGMKKGKLQRMKSGRTVN